MPPKRSIWTVEIHNESAILLSIVVEENQDLCLFVSDQDFPLSKKFTDRELLVQTVEGMKKPFARRRVE